MDGEIIGGEGKTVAERSEVIARLFKKRTHVTLEDKKFSYYAFDILYLDGRDLRELPIEERRKILQDLIPQNFRQNYGIYVVEYHKEDIRLIREVAEEEGFEGIVYKKKGSKYKKTPGVASPWAKQKFRVDTLTRNKKK